jgi:nucleoside-diphosphate-sugar epimerase
VRDLGRAIAEVVDADPLVVQSQIFNVGDERLNTTILELAKAVQRVAVRYRPVDISVTEDPADKRNYMVSFTKIQRMLGFRAQTLLEDGVSELIDKHRSGAYAHYREEAYSNVAMTRRALERFHDPDELSRLYAPLAR